MMNISRCIGKIINRYGCAAKVINGEKCEDIRAFFQPLRYKAYEHRDSSRILTGFRRNSMYLFFCENDLGLVPDKTVIEVCRRKYIVKRCEAYYMQDCPVYTWAVLGLYADSSEDDYEQN